MIAMASHRPSRGWSTRSSLGAVLVAAGACLSGSAWAANSSGLVITFKGVQPSDNVSVSRLPGLPVDVAYRILVENPVTNPNTINQVVFTGTTDVAGYAGFVTIAGPSPNCPAGNPSVDMSVKSVSCQIGQLKSGDSREFFLLFQTPTTGTQITFNGHTEFSEGNSSSSTASTYTKDLAPVSIALITADPDGANGYRKKVKTVLSPLGGTFFTGVDGAVDSNNPWSAAVAIPATSFVTNNEIHLEPDSAAPMSFACKPGYFCYGLTSNISVLDASTGMKVVLDPLNAASFLTIKLRQDISSLAVKKPLPAIGAIQIFYNAATTDPADVGTALPDCNASLPTAGNPCIFGRDDTHLAKNKKSGYYEWTIHAKDNGKYTQ